MRFNIIETKNGQQTVEIQNSGRKYYLHSRYNPRVEADRWVSNIQINKTQKIFIIGMGCGHHIKALVKKFPTTIIEVWEFNNFYYNWILSTGEIAAILCHNNVSYFSSENIKEIQMQLFEKINNENSLFLIYKPSITLIGDDLDLIKGKLEDIEHIYSSFLNQKQALELNFENNMKLNDQGITKLINKYKNKPFILVSAGPSLTKQLPLLKEIKETTDVVVCCVGTALRPLTRSGIIPDYVMVTDPQDQITKQFEGTDTIKLKLFYLITANWKAVNYFNGERYVVYQEEYTEARRLAVKKNETLIQTGGSVATSLLDVIGKLGGNPIALVGQDLAFTGSKTHAEDTPLIQDVNKDLNYLEVDDFYLQGKVTTAKNLSIYRKWFENYLKKKQNSNRYWNCTEGGAYINGWKHDSLQNLYSFIKTKCVGDRIVNRKH